MEKLINFFIEKIIKVNNIDDFIEVLEWLCETLNCGISINTSDINWEFYPFKKEGNFLKIKSNKGFVEVTLPEDEDILRFEKRLELLVNGIEKILDFLILMKREEEERKLLDSILNAMDFPVFIFDKNRVIKYANKKTGEFFGENPINKRCFEVFHYSSYPPVFCIFDEILRKKEMVRREIYDWNLKRFFEIIHYPIIKDGEVEEIIGIIRDITGFIETQRTLTQSARMVFLGEMASAIAHELNNPISAIMGLAELIFISQNVPKEIQDYAKKIKEAAQRSSEVVRSILRFARGGITKKEKVPFEVNSAINDILNFIKVFIEKEGIKLNFEKKEDVIYLFGNKNLFQQVILNLLLNAKDAIVEKGKRGNIWIRTYKRNGEVYIEVEDTGKGIPHEIRDEIFLPFFTTKKPGKGTGLGLSFVKNIVEDHEGEIFLESEVGKGTKFILRFREYEKKPIEIKPPAEPQEKKSYKILICDDEKVVLNFLKAGFEALEHEVDITSEPLEVMKFIENKNYDIVILDIFMPIKRGDQIYEELIKKFPEYKKKVIFITGVIADEKIEKKIKEWEIPVFYKPISYADLPYIINQIKGM